MAYRWAVLLAGLIAAVFAAHRLEPSLVVAVAGPLVGSVAATAMVVMVGAERRATTLVLAVDLVLGAVSVSLTGGALSPFVVYLSASLFALALRPSSHGFLASLGIAAISYLAAVAASGGGANPGPVVDDVAGFVLAPGLLRFLVRPLAEPPMSSLSVDDELLLRLLDGRLTYAEIATHLSISQETAKVRISRLYRQLGARTRDEALTHAKANGTLGTED